MKKFKLADYRSNGAKIFTGRDNGMRAREYFNLDQTEEEEDIIQVLIPKDTWGINPSFFGGMFEGSIKKYGTRFGEKYEFVYSNGDELSEELKQDIIDDTDYVIRNIEVEG